MLLEKDFWVSWVLGVLYRSPFRDQLVFKGGTSLSKVFGLIERFSEDIDLSVSPGFLGIAEDAVEGAVSRTKRDAWMEEMQTRCARAVRETIQPVLEKAAVGALGGCEGERSWFEFQMDAYTKSPVMLFHYPTASSQGFAYLKRSVKLEFGSLTDQQPVGSHPIVPLVAGILPVEFDDWKAVVVALEAERTFWEKAAILHAEFHRPADRPMPDRYARHFADVAAIATHPIGERAIGDGQLRDRVIAWKSRFFHSGWASYASARPGSFRLVPPANRRDALRRDYDAMRDMYFGQPIAFESVINALASVEARINAIRG